MVFKKLLSSVLISFAFAQEQDPPVEKKCQGALEKVPDNEANINVKVKYDSEIPLSVKIGKGWKSFFTTSDDTNCQISKCVLKD